MKAPVPLQSHESPPARGGWGSRSAWGAATLATAIWLYLAYRLALAEPRLATQLSFGLTTVVLIAWATRYVLLQRRASLRMIVLVVPLVFAVACLPLRVVTQNSRLQRSLQSAGINDYSLVASGPWNRWLQDMASHIAGEGFGSRFSTAVERIQISLDAADVDRLLTLPSEGLRFAAIVRQDATSPTLDERLIHWIHRSRHQPLVSFKLRTPVQSEMDALGELQEDAILKLSDVAFRELRLDLPTVYELICEDGDFSGGPESLIRLPAISRVDLNACRLDASSPLFDALSAAQDVSLRGCSMDDATLGRVFHLPIRDLTLSGTTISDAVELPQSDRRLGRSVALYDCQIPGSQVLRLLEGRRTTAVQLGASIQLTVQELDRVLRLPDVVFLSISGPWATQEHLVAVTEVRKPLRIDVMDTSLTLDEEAWLQENKTAQVVMSFHRNPDALAQPISNSEN